MNKCKECDKEISKKARQCPNCGIDTRNWFMRHKILSAIGIFVIIGILGSIGGEDDSNDSNPKVATEADSANESESTEKMPEITISATELASAYEENEVKANQDYKGKLAEINGTVKSIGESAGTTYIVLAAGGDFALTETQCFFKDEEDINKIADINKGDDVTVIGEISGMSLNISVRNCKFK